VSIVLEAPNDSTVGPSGVGVGLGEGDGVGVGVGGEGDGVVGVVGPFIEPTPSHEQVLKRPSSAHSWAPVVPLLQAQATLAPGMQRL